MSIYCAEVLSPPVAGPPQPEAGPAPGAGRRAPSANVKLLLISQKPDGFFLQRFSEGGALVGETRHEEMDEAQREAYSEYSAVSEWRLCPDDADPLEYIREGSQP